MRATACATRAAVHTLVEEGPAAIEELIEWGAEFDRDGSHLSFTREGAHSRNRILHAHGDSTGKEIARTLYRRAASLPNVTFRSFAATTDLLTVDGEVGGALVSGRAIERARRRLAREPCCWLPAAWARVPQHHQSGCRDRRWRGHGLPGGRGDFGYRIRAVPSHRAARGRSAAIPALGGAARRGRAVAKPGGRALHGALSSAAGTGAARCGGARHRSGNDA